MPPSHAHPDGYITTRHGNCAHNPSGKDRLHPDEIREIANQHFSTVKNKPCPLPLDFKNGSRFDDLIAGWSQYWNEVFTPSDPLDPNLVKALIATESSFNPDKLADKNDPDSARGLTQVTNESRKILGNEKGEIKDHYITATKKDLNDPSMNICAGIRWLSHKRALASKHLGHQATWMETISEYKDASIASKKRAKELMDRVMKKYEIYQKCGKN